LTRIKKSGIFPILSYSLQVNIVGEGYFYRIFSGAFSPVLEGRPVCISESYLHFVSGFDLVADFICDLSDAVALDSTFF
jgi:hypothetical protein